MIESPEVDYAQHTLPVVLPYYACSLKMRRLADEVANLTLLETLDLTELLKEKLGLASR